MGRGDEPPHESDAYSTRASLAHGDVAGRLGCLSVLALRTCARSCRVSQTDVREAVAGLNTALHAAEDDQVRALVDFAELRWRVERDYQQLEQEVET
jgi:hypothetical protein